MNYKDLNDYEIMNYINENSEQATEIMFKKYEPLITSIAKKMYNSVGNVGIELNDLIQEGMLGLSLAIKSFDESKDVVFYTLARKCIESKIISYVVACKRKKHQALNESVSYDYTNDDDLSFEKVLGDYEINPEKIMLDKEMTENILKSLNDNLSEFEQQVFELKTSGFTYKEIALFLEKKPKDIDNTLNRIKTKLKKVIKNI